MIAGGGAVAACAAATAVFCVDDNYSDQERPRRAGLALQQPDGLRRFLTGAAIESVLITTADPRALAPAGSATICPRGCERLDLGVSLAAIVGDGPEIAGYAVALDFTRLDVPPTQTYLARSFPTHMVLGEPIAAARIDLAAGLGMRLLVDGEVYQDSTTARMIATPTELLETISRHYELRAGDLLLTGSPAGRPADTDGPWIKPGSFVVGEITGIGSVSASVTAEAIV